MYWSRTRDWTRSGKLLMKKILFITILILSLPSSACLLVAGEVKVNNDTLQIHQKINLDESYPYRTTHYLIHLKLLSSKSNNLQPAQIIVRHPRTYKVLIDKKFDLQANKEIVSKLANEEIALTSKLKLKHI